MRSRAAEPALAQIEKLVQEHLGWKDLATAGKDAVAHKLEMLVQEAGGATRLVEEMLRDTEVLQTVCERLLIHETSFFRHRVQFDWLQERGLPTLYRSKRTKDRAPKVSAWSCACSSGEEAFSLAVVMLTAFPAAEGWRVSVLGTDASRAVLERAALATWPSKVQSCIPDDMLYRFFLQGKGRMEGVIRASPEVRRVVRFNEFLLGSGQPMLDGPFDLIFCRNVLIYFDEAHLRAVVRELTGNLAQGGYLVFGPSDFAGAALSDMDRVGPGIYQRKAGNDRV